MISIFTCCNSMLQTREFTGNFNDVEEIGTSFLCITTSRIMAPRRCVLSMRIWPIIDAVEIYDIDDGRLCSVLLVYKGKDKWTTEWGVRPAPCPCMRQKAWNAVAPLEKTEVDNHFTVLA